MHILVFIATGTMGAVAHLFMISAFNKAEASLLAPYNYTKLLWVTILGYWVFGDIPSIEMDWSFNNYFSWFLCNLWRKKCRMKINFYCIKLKKKSNYL